MQQVEYEDFVKSNAPYPKLRVVGPNKKYANLLKEDYASLHSEATSITQYLYHHYVLNDVEKEISIMLREVAFVEAEHFDALAKLIVLLGEKPIYHSNDGFWKSNYVNYGFDILEQLKSDLRLEYIAIENYKRHIEQIDDRYIKAVLRRIILDEEAHIQFFKLAIANVENSRQKNKE